MNKYFEYFDDGDEIEMDENSIINMLSVGDVIVPNFQLDHVDYTTTYYKYSYVCPDGRVENHVVSQQVVDSWANNNNNQLIVGNIDGDKFELSGSRGYWYMINEWKSR